MNKRRIPFLLITTLLLCSLSCFILPVPATGKAALPITTPSALAARTHTHTPTRPTPTPTLQPRCAVNTAALNLRACAGTHCTTQNWLHEGDVLAILAHDNQWLKVETQSRQTGWVHSKFCTGE